MVNLFFIIYNMLEDKLEDKFLKKKLTYNQRETVFESVLDSIHFLPGGLGPKPNLPVILIDKNRDTQIDSSSGLAMMKRKKDIDFGAVYGNLSNHNISHKKQNESFDAFIASDFKISEWKYLNSRGEFAQFPKIINEYLENHYLDFRLKFNQNAKVDFSMNGDRYRLHFKKEGKRYRLIFLSWIKIEIPIFRCEDEDQNSSIYYENFVWGWTNDNHILVKYDKYENDLLDHHYAKFLKEEEKNRKFYIRLSTGKAYQIDFFEMTQINLETKCFRKIAIIKIR